MTSLTTRCATTLALAALIGPFGCGDDKPAAGPACVPGESRACTGPGGCEGGQICADDGRSFAECDCSGTRVDAAAPEPDASVATDAESAAPDAPPESRAEGGADAGPPGDGGPPVDAHADARTDAPSTAPPMGPFGCVGGHVRACGDGQSDPGEICYLAPTRVDLATTRDNVYLDITSADLDENGRAEILTLLREGEGMARLHVVGIDDDGNWVAADPLDICDGCDARLAVGDVDGDTHSDAVVLAVSSDAPFIATAIHIHALLGDGTGKLAAPSVTEGQIQSLFGGLLPDFAVTAGDADGNGADEIFFSMFGNDGFVFPMDETGSFVLSPPYARFGVDGWPRLADLTGDGYPEVIGGTGALGIALNNGRGGYDFASSYGGVVGPGASSADMDQDGFLDLVVRNLTQARIVYGNGYGGVIGAGTLIDTAAPVDALFAADVTADDCLDLIAIHAGVFSVLAATGGGQFDRFRTYPGLSGEVVAADIDGDGVTDLATVDSANHTLDVVMSNP